MKAFIRTGKGRYVVSLLVILSVLLAFGAVWASSEGGHGDSAGKVKDLIWRIMNFAVLAGGLIFLLRKPLAKGLESRRHHPPSEHDGKDDQNGDGPYIDQ